MPLLAESDLNAARLVTPFALRAPLESTYYMVCAEPAAGRKDVAEFRKWLLAEAAKEQV
jgi:LysR family glycine cleavage system transcriptional activator